MTFLSAITFAWAACYASTSLWAYLRARRFFRAAPPSSLVRAPVLVVRPCAGDEAHLRENLASTALAAKLGDTIVFAIAKANDGASHAVHEARDALVARGWNARVEVTFADASNRKVDQIARVLARETDHPIVVVADSDVALCAGDIDALVHPLIDPRVAASWAPPCETSEARTFGDRCARGVLSGSLHAFPLLAGLDGHGMVGKLVAVKRTSLAKVGGFGALAQHLGEDMELARRFRALGERVTSIPRIAHARASGRTFEDTALRFARWLTVIRAQRTLLLAGYPFLFCALPFFVLGALVLRTPLAIAALVLALGARLAIAAVACAIAGDRVTPRRVVVDTFLAEATLLVALGRALFTRSVRWRDRTLRFDRNGLLAAEDEP